MRMLICNDRDRLEFIKRIQQIDLSGRPFIADFKLYRKKRSIASNKLYWYWLRCIEKESGNDSKTLHSYFKDKYLPWKGSEIFGEDFRQVPSTTDLNTQQFSEYLAQIKSDMLNQGIYLPEPGDRGWDEFLAQYKD